jgi:hypothetical protein
MYLRWTSIDTRVKKAPTFQPVHRAGRRPRSPVRPGESRKLKVDRWQTAPAAPVLSVENQPLQKLYYALEGDVTIEKAGYSKRRIAPRAFIGEVAFLLPQPASAPIAFCVLRSVPAREWVRPWVEELGRQRTVPSVATCSLQNYPSVV